MVIVGNFIVVLKFYPSTHKSVKQCGYSFAFDALDLLQGTRSHIVPLALLSPSRIWVCGLILIFPCPNLFKMSAKVILCTSVFPSILLHIFLPSVVLIVPGGSKSGSKFYPFIYKSVKQFSYSFAVNVPIV